MEEANEAMLEEAKNVASKVSTSVNKLEGQIRGRLNFEFLK